MLTKTKEIWKSHKESYFVSFLKTELKQELELKSLTWTMLLTEAIGYQTKIPMPGIGHLMNCWPMS